MEMLPVFWEIHSGNRREGPGDDKSTLKALSLAKDLPPKPVVLDIGCGPGAQTMALAGKLDGNIFALDNHQPFLSEVEKRAAAAGFSKKIKTVNGSMLDLPFKHKYFNLIWSEGAIYIMGFEKGIREWKAFLKPGGYISVSEFSWLKDGAPNEALRYFGKECPQMHSVEENLEIIKKEGYSLAGHFALPAASWWDVYYQDIARKLSPLEEKYRDDEKAMETINAEKYEMELMLRYGEFMGYEFYVMRNKKG